MPKGQDREYSLKWSSNWQVQANTGNAYANTGTAHEKSGNAHEKSRNASAKTANANAKRGDSVSTVFPSASFRSVAATKFPLISDS